MRKTCIICGGSAGSGEHVFPAALGGRRTNRNIYCGPHDNAYSGLAGIIAGQLSIFNAQLGVIKDHGKEPVATTMTDLATGQEIVLTAEKTQFRGPQVKASEGANGETIVELAVSSMKAAEAWRAQMKEKGIEIPPFDKGRRVTRFGGTARKSVQLGGNEEGLRAIAYITQTFFAQAFPAMARETALQPLKDYTLKNVGAGFAWWDFAPPGDLPDNTFPFGHRVVVGLDRANGIAYGRISFFSTLHFALVLAELPLQESCAVITDIDPLAKSPPNDIRTWRVETALGAVTRPADPTAALAKAVRSGRGEAAIRDLMRRIQTFATGNAAAAILTQAGNAATLPDADREALFSQIVDGEAQRVLNLMRHGVRDAKQRISNPVEQAFSAFLEHAVALDPDAENGLTPQAEKSLKDGCAALARQMSAECKAGTLDKARVSLLIGGGPGAFITLEPLQKAFARSINRRRGS